MNILLSSSKKFEIKFNKEISEYLIAEIIDNTWRYLTW